MNKEFLEKKAKNDKVSSLVQPASRIFEPYRVIGHVTNEVPFCMLNRGSAFYVTTCVENSFHIYDCQHLRLLFVGPVFEKKVCALACFKDFTFVGLENRIVVCERAKIIFELEIEGSAMKMTVIGDYLLVLTDANILFVIHHSEKRIMGCIEFGNNFTASTFLHPHTFINKIIVASPEGRLQLWNFSTKSMIHEFERFSSPILSLFQTPAVDIICIGLLDGEIILFNLKTGKRLFQLLQNGPVTGIAMWFDGDPLLATCNNVGDIMIWNLEEKKLMHRVLGAHDGAIYGLEFIPGQPIIVSTGNDNCIKEWILNEMEPRVLCQRSGHYQPPSMVRFYGPDGKNILSAGKDRSFRLFSTIRDAQNVELSAGNVSKRAKSLQVKLEEAKPLPIKHFSSSFIRSKDWDNAVTCHKNDKAARTWRILNKTIGKHLLKPLDDSFFTCSCLSPCGNFVLLGTTSGRIEVFNIQSGIHRKTFVGHSKEVTGVCMNSDNSMVISCSLDATVRFWNFQKVKAIGKLDLTSTASMMTCSEGDLIGVACDDNGIRIIDVDTKKIIREHFEHEGRITDMAFSADNRWLISCSLDLTIKTFDIPSGCLVDSITVQSAPTSLAFSPISDYLATVHVDSIGIHLWFNKTMFNSVPLEPISDADDDRVWNFENNLTMEDNLITFSNSVSRSKWTTLFHLDSIKSRNKPKVAPKGPERAPFFLTASSAAEVKVEEKEESASMIKVDLEFAELLAEKSFASLAAHMEKMSASSVDFEIRSLSAANDFADFLSFLHFLHCQFESKKNFELYNAYLNILLKIHYDLMRDNQHVFREPFEKLQTCFTSLWKQVEPSLQGSLCLLSFLLNN